MVSVLTLYMLAATGSGLTLDLRSPQTEVLVGEPVKLALTWRASKKLEVHIEDEDQGLRFLAILVDDGSGGRRYWEAGRTIAEQVTAVTELKAGAEAVQNIVLLRGGYGESPPPPGTQGFVFPKPGRHSLKVLYGDSTKLRSESNTVTFEVKEPTGEDKQVFDLLRKDPDLLTAPDKAAKALQAHPKSRHLQLARIYVAQERQAKLADRKDPDTNESLWHLDREAFEGLAASKFRQMAEDVMEEDWGAFEEERLETAAQYAALGRDNERAERAKTELRERFPRSAAVKHMQEKDAAAVAKRVEEDNTPPLKPIKPEN